MKQLFIGILLSIFTVACIYMGYWVGEQSGEQKRVKATKRAFAEGKMAGRSEGYFKGHETGLRNAGDISVVAVGGFKELVDLTEEKFASLTYQKNIANNITELKKMAEPDKFQQFSSILKDIHEKILYGVEDMYDLPRNMGEKMMATYNDVHEQLAQKHYQQFESLNQATLVNNSNHFVSYNNYQTIKNFNTVLRNNICLVIDAVLPVIKFKYASKIVSYAQAKAEAERYNSVSENVDSISFAKATNQVLSSIIEDLCEDIFSEVLSSLSANLLEHAVIKDISSLQLREKSRTAIAELATVEDAFTAVEKKAFRRDIAWGYLPPSDSEISIEFKSIVKAGVQLDDYFEIKVEQEKKLVTITLSEPTILSNEPNYKVLRLKDGWIWNEIDEKLLNRTLEDGKQQIEQLALESGILEDAKENARQIFHTILQPLTSLPENVYEVNVRFANDPVKQTDE